MEPITSNSPSIQEISSFLKSSFESLSSAVQEKLIVLENSFKKELKNAIEEGKLLRKRQEDECVELNQNVARLEEENKGLSEKIIQVERDYVTVKQNVKEKDEEIKSLLKSIDELRDEKNQAEYKLSSYAEKFNELAARVTLQKKKVQATSSKGNGPLPPSSVALESKPRLAKCKVNAVPDKPGSSSPIVLISDSEDEMTRNEKSKRCEKKKVAKPYKRKRVEGEGGSSCGLEKTKLVGEEVQFPPPRRHVKRTGGNDSVCDDDSTCTGEMNLLLENMDSRWWSEDHLRSALKSDPQLCLHAVCALFRQKTSSSRKLSYSMDKKSSIDGVGKYLIKGDADKKLKRRVSELTEKQVEICKRLATAYCRQLFELYHSKEDSLFCPGANLTGS